MVSRYTKSQLQNEAVAILEDKAKRSINDIRSRTEFIRSSLRAQGNTQINLLSLPIRQLTMRDFCHEYGADNLKVFQQQAKARFYRVKKRTRDDMEKDDESSATAAITTAECTSLPQQQLPMTLESPIKRVKRVLPQRAVKGKSIQTVKRVQIEQPPKISSPPSSSLEDENGHEEDSDNNDNDKNNVIQHISLETSNIPQQTRNLSTNTSITATTETTSMKNNNKEDEDEEEFGPMFVHLERPNHPRVGFQVDPQRTLNELGHFAVHMPDEVFGRMNQLQRDNLYNQIQDIQNQLDKVKLQLRKS
ncbi:hypothetical protein INT45_012899 [Circinella minor]|uniref:Borealin N-terminal domain-containing protein n=1 Tax=Circinella minor TaxID=1195481 RepID=A0A8H7VKV6_9FUNG|nr:hypothetical protein INT45_012899 [Circinella minor]